MQKVTYGAHWLELRDPDEVQVQHSRKIEALLSSVEGATRRVQAAAKLELAKLDLPEDQEPTDEQAEAALRDCEPNPPLTEDESDRMLQLEQAALVAVIARWDRPDAISRATFETMARRDYKPLLKAAKPSADACMKSLRVDFEPSTDPDVPPNPTDDIPFGGSPA